MTRDTGPTDAWALVETERRRDRSLRQLCSAAWGVTVLVVLAYALIVGVQLAHVMRLRAVGAASSDMVYATAMPLLIVLGVLSLLVATLSTVGIFLRLRTASLTEIQLRLSALEEMLAGGVGRP